VFQQEQKANANIRLIPNQEVGLFIVPVETRW